MARSLFWTVALALPTQLPSMIANSSCSTDEDVLPILVEEPSVAIKLLEVERRLRRTSDHVEDLSFGELSVRMAKVLLRFAELQGTVSAPQTAGDGDAKGTWPDRRAIARENQLVTCQIAKGPAISR